MRRLGDLPVVEVAILVIAVFVVLAYFAGWGPR